MGGIIAPSGYERMLSELMKASGLSDIGQAIGRQMPVPLPATPPVPTPMEAAIPYGGPLAMQFAGPEVAAAGPEVAPSLLQQVQQKTGKPIKLSEIDLAQPPQQERFELGTAGRAITSGLLSAGSTRALLRGAPSLARNIGAGLSGSINVLASLANLTTPAEVAGEEAASQVLARLPFGKQAATVKESATILGKLGQLAKTPASIAIPLAFGQAVDELVNPERATLRERHFGVGAGMAFGTGLQSLLPGAVRRGAALLPQQSQIKLKEALYRMLPTPGLEELTPGQIAAQPGLQGRIFDPLTELRVKSELEQISPEEAVGAAARIPGASARAAQVEADFETAKEAATILQREYESAGTKLSQNLAQNRGIMLVQLARQLNQRLTGEEMTKKFKFRTAFDGAMNILNTVIKGDPELASDFVHTRLTPDGMYETAAGLRNLPEQFIDAYYNLGGRATGAAMRRPTQKVALTGIPTEEFIDQSLPDALRKQKLEQDEILKGLLDETKASIKDLEKPEFIKQNYENFLARARHSNELGVPLTELTKVQRQNLSAAMSQSPNEFVDGILFKKSATGYAPVDQTTVKAIFTLLGNENPKGIQSVREAFVARLMNESIQSGQKVDEALAMTTSGLGAPGPVANVIDQLGGTGALQSIMGPNSDVMIREIANLSNSIDEATQVWKPALAGSAIARYMGSPLGTSLFNVIHASIPGLFFVGAFAAREPGLWFATVAPLAGGLATQVYRVQLGKALANNARAMADFSRSIKSVTEAYKQLNVPLMQGVSGTAMTENLRTANIFQSLATELYRVGNFGELMSIFNKDARGSVRMVPKNQVQAMTGRSPADEYGHGIPAQGF